MLPEDWVGEAVRPERIQEVGGKAAILESMVEQWPEAPTLPFSIGAEPTFSCSRIAVRTSHPLDVVGGFGLSGTILGVPYDDVAEAIDRIRVNERGTSYAERAFYDRHGADPSESTVLLQWQDYPAEWIKMLPHPQNPEVFIFNTSTTPSIESAHYGMDASEFEGRKRRDRTTNSYIVFEATEQWESAFIRAYKELENRGIIRPGVLNMIEGGVYRDGNIEIYQVTPVRRRTDVPDDGRNFARDDQFIAGQMKMRELQLLYIPSVVEIEHMYRTGKNSQRFIPFRNRLEYELKLQRRPSIHQLFSAIERATSILVQHHDENVPDGYAIVTSDDRLRTWDLAMQHAAAVFVHAPSRKVYGLLDHAGSRLLYSAPLLYSGDIGSIDIEGVLISSSTADIGAEPDQMLVFSPGTLNGRG